MNALISKVGKGQKGAKDLTWEESKEAMTALVEGSATPAQVGAFLMAMRIKMESITELAAFTIIARQYVAPVIGPAGGNLIDLPIYGEKHGTYHAVIAASLVAASAGVTILLHGVENPAAACQLSEVVKQVGIPIPEDLDSLSRRFSTSPLVYLDLALYHPPLVRLLDLRQELGGQNLAHQVARMLNPARAQSQVIGLAHPPYLDKIIEALRLIETPRALVFQGVEGFPELSITVSTPGRELRGGHVTPLTFRPQDIGMRFGSYQTMSSASFSGRRPRPEEEAALVVKILRNQIRGDHRAWVLLNASLLIYAGGQASSLMRALPLATQALDSGSALETLQKLAAQPTNKQSNLSPSTTVVPA